MELWSLLSTSESEYAILALDMSLAFPSSQVYIFSTMLELFNPIQDGLSANLFGTRGGGFRPPLSSRLVGPEGPQNRFPWKAVMYMRPTKKNWADRPKIGAVSPNSKFQPNGWSVRKAYFKKIQVAAQKSP